ncbi:SRPBCC family protein [Desertivirga arenae]|uniref:SRPBCC family protein n=1 Tax=Desertivirga arenae TaxID=2810309 RepID=UPI001A96998F|nr:SRPBCC domain-containing protein [Pedobacter sp. SYSU D00823]
MGTNNELSLEVTREFKVPAEQVYNAWTEFEALKQWWKPLNSELTDLQNDLKSEGVVQYTFTRTDNNETYTVGGEYSEVVPGKKLVYSWKWELPEETSTENDYQLDVEFNDQGSGSVLRVKQQGFESEEASKPHYEGWESALDALESYLNGGSAASDSGSQDAEVAGWNEAPEQQKVAE